jgi:hypothetical protein
MKLEPVRLPVRLVPAKLQPLETVVNRIERSLSVSFDISVIDAKNHCAAMVAGIEPVENKSSRAAYVEVAGR